MPTKTWIEVPIDQEIEGVPTEGYAPYFFPTEGGTALFRFTEGEFNQVLSALINGAALTYPDSWLQVVWYFLRSVEFPVPICEQIIDCIENDADTIEAIVTALKSSDTFNEYIDSRVFSITGGQLGGKLTGGACDSSVLAGRVMTLINRMNTTNVDALEIIETGTNDEETTALVLGGIPVFETLPFDEVIDFAQDLLENFAENYNSAITEEWKSDVGEDLYCLARQSEDCSLSFEQLFLYFQARAGSGLNIASALVDVINFVRFGDFPNDELIASGMYAAQLAFVLHSREFFGINVPKMGALMRDATPSSIWEEWDECPVCVGTWPDPMTFFVGSITARVGDVYSVDIEPFGAPGYELITTSEYGDWSKGDFMLSQVDVIGATPFQLYAEDDAGVFYDGNDIAALNLLLPRCARYFQAVKRYDTGSFSLDVTIET